MLTAPYYIKFKMSQKESIQVTVRIRPLSQKELNEDARTCLKLDTTVTPNIVQVLTGSQPKNFSFDSIASNDTQADIFHKVGRISALDSIQGYNCTVFAYGQTGAGKTYTMMGAHEDCGDSEERGLIPRTLEYLFQCVDEDVRANQAQYHIRCSFIEIYNEQIIDLLNRVSNNMQLREDSKKGVYIEGATEQVIQQSADAMEILRKGSKGRHVGSTCYNETSSRSHSVLTLQLTSKMARSGLTQSKNRYFHFIDLAGSQRTKQSMGDRLREGCSINKSLHVLGMVISSLSESTTLGKTRHINYRDSKLTFLLKDSLGGNSKTHLIANVSPSAIACQETLSTLLFAKRVKSIKLSKVVTNSDSIGSVDSLKAEIKRLTHQLLQYKMSFPLGVDQISTDPSNEQKVSPTTERVTAVLENYVSEQVEKQTRMELEVTRLLDRVSQLEEGIKHYVDNDLHLRLIISIYEDKVKRFTAKTTGKTGSLILMEQLPSTSQLLEDKPDRNDPNHETISEAELELETLRKLVTNPSLVSTLLNEMKKASSEDGPSLKEALESNTQYLHSLKDQLAMLINGGQTNSYQALEEEPKSKDGFMNASNMSPKVDAETNDFMLTGSASPIGKREIAQSPVKSITRNFLPITSTGSHSKADLEEQVTNLQKKNIQTECLLKDAVYAQISLEQDNLYQLRQIQYLKSELDQLEAILDEKDRERENAVKERNELLSNRESYAKAQEQIAGLQEQLEAAKKQTAESMLSTKIQQNLSTELKNQLESIKLQYQNDQSRLSKAQKELLGLGEKCSLLEVQLNETQSQIQVKQIKLKQVEEEHGIEQTKYETILKELDFILTSQSQLIAERDRLVFEKILWVDKEKQFKTMANKLEATQREAQQLTERLASFSHSYDTKSKATQQQVSSLSNQLMIQIQTEEKLRKQITHLMATMEERSQEATGNSQALLQLQSEHQKLSEAYLQETTNRKKLTDQLTELLTTIDDAIAEKCQKDKQIQHLMTSKESIMKLMHSKQQQIQELLSEKEKLFEAVKSNETTINQYSKRNSELEMTLQTDKIEIIQAESEKTNLNGEINTLKEQMQKISQNVVILTNLLQFASVKEKQLIAKIETIENQNYQLQNLSANNQGTAEEQKSLIYSQKQQIMGLNAQLERQKTQMATIKQMFEDLKIKSQNYELTLKVQQSRIAILQAQNNEYSQQLYSATQKLNSLNNQSLIMQKQLQQQLLLLKTVEAERQQVSRSLVQAKTEAKLMAELNETIKAQYEELGFLMKSVKLQCQQLRLKVQNGLQEKEQMEGIQIQLSQQKDSLQISCAHLTTELDRLAQSFRLLSQENQTIKNLASQSHGNLENTVQKYQLLEGQLIEMKQSYEQLRQEATTMETQSLRIQKLYQQTEESYREQLQNTSQVLAQLQLQKGVSEQSQIRLKEAERKLMEMSQQQIELMQNEQHTITQMANEIAKLTQASSQEREIWYSRENSLIQQNQVVGGQKNMLVSKCQILQKQLAQMTSQLESKDHQLVQTVQQKMELGDKLEFTIKTSVKQLEVTKEALTQQNSFIRTELLEVNNKYAALLNDNGSLMEQFNSIKGQLQSLAETHSSLQGDFNSVSKNYNQLEEAHKQLSAFSAQLKTAYSKNIELSASKESQIESLTSSIEEFRFRLAQQQGLSNQKQCHVSSLQQTIQVLQAQKESLNGVINSQENQSLLHHERMAQMEKLLKSDDDQKRAILLEKEDLESAYKKLLTQVAINTNELRKNEANRQKEQEANILLEKTRKDQLELRKCYQEVKKYNDDLLVSSKKLKDLLEDRERQINDMKAKQEENSRWIKAQNQNTKRQTAELERLHQTTLAAAESETRKIKEHLERMYTEATSLKKEASETRAELNTSKKMEAKLLMKIATLENDVVRLSEQQQAMHRSSKPDEIGLSNQREESMVRNINKLKLENNMLRVSLAKARQDAQRREGESSESQVDVNYQMEKKNQQIKANLDFLSQLCVHLRVVKPNGAKFETLKNYVLGALREKTFELERFKQANAKLEKEIDIMGRQSQAVMKPISTMGQSDSHVRSASISTSSVPSRFQTLLNRLSTNTIGNQDQSLTRGDASRLDRKYDMMRTNTDESVPNVSMSKSSIRNKENGRKI